MALLLAAFGSVASREWGSLTQELTSTYAPNRCTWWHHAEAAARLGVAGAVGETHHGRDATADLLAVGAGRLDGGGGVADAVVASYSRGGLSGLRGLRGEYAFALWDARARTLFAGCDAVSLRAPAYTWDGRTFLLSSRAVALLRTPEAFGGWDDVYLADAFSGLWSRSASATPFRRIRRMVGGELLRVSANGLERLVGDRLTFRCVPVRDDRGAIEELETCLDRAVRSKAADQGNCISLSGGLDSSIVASALAVRSPQLDCFSLVSKDAPFVDPAISTLANAFPGFRQHRVEICRDLGTALSSSSLSDDPISAAPALQGGRAALLRTARDNGCGHLFDGEGGDEVFDMAWRPCDLVRDLAFRQIFSALSSRRSALRMIHDGVADSSVWPVSNVLLARIKRRVRSRRSWLRESFWEGRPFEAAWGEALSHARRKSVHERLPEIVSVHGRHWRAQHQARLSVGIEGSSPLLDRNVVELVGSLRARVVIDPRYSKALLRRLAQRRLPSSVAWRPKSDSLHDWLVGQSVLDDALVERIVRQIKASKFLATLIDSVALVAVIHEVRRVQAAKSLASSLVELFALVDWVAAVEAQYRL